MKYKVGDSVLMRKDLSADERYGEIGTSYRIPDYSGKILTICAVHDRWYDMKGVDPFGIAFMDGMIERKVDMFTKDDLKSNDIMVKVRNGNLGLIADGTLYAKGITDDLRDNMGNKVHDIVEVFRIVSIWKREEETEMTMEEINAALGKTIKVVEKH